MAEEKKITSISDEELEIASGGEQNNDPTKLPCQACGQPTSIYKLMCEHCGKPARIDVRSSIKPQKPL